MENHHHCKRCDDMITPTKTYCSTCERMTQRELLLHKIIQHTKANGDEFTHGY
jgi:hypothetical protein